ncbi:MAG: 1-deoxy-D-xylulose-5-phosphate reductoisomerase [Candidatus Omnitrophota bacterium]|jgi:1-deoxy-D-xylulose-5-phosphate reductoisomerase
MMQQIAVLGSTGSIGQSALEVIRHFPAKFKVLALSTNSRTDILSEQIKEFHPAFACVRDVQAGRALEAESAAQTKFLLGESGLEEIIRDKRLDKIVLGISGSAGLEPLLKSIEAGCDIVLANKEALVMAGPILMKRARQKKARIMPVDSEQSAIWQCLEGRNPDRLKNVYLTASGGPFLQSDRKQMRGASVARVLRHPRWKMGKKISVDSANLMNKGLEVLEAMYLFNLPADKIKVLIHPEAIIHSMVEFMDGVVMAQLSATDMRIPIQYALTYPERLSNSLPSIDFYKLKALNFQKPDFKKFPCLGLAYRAAGEAGTMPCVLNAANEVSVEGFLRGGLAFVSIPGVIARVLDAHRKIENPGLEDILAADEWARKEARKVIQRERAVL